MYHFLTLPFYPYTLDDIDVTSDIAFEIIYTLIVANANGFYHGDIALRNIMVRKVSYKRHYIINGIAHIVEYEYMPIIIDWVNPYGSITEAAPDLNDFSALFEDENLVNLFSDKFDYLRANTVNSTDKIKYFTPFDFPI